MRNYTLEQLGQAETYKNDKALFGLARTIAEAAYSSREQWLPYRDEITCGIHPQVVLDWLQKQTAEQDRKLEAESRALFTKNAKIRKALETLTLPGGVEIVGNTEAKIFVKAPWDGGDLAQRFGRIGGEWNRQQKYFEFPIESAPSLQRVLNNWRKAQDERDVVAAEQKREHEAAKAKAQAEREAQWAKERQEQQAAYEAQRKAQAKAVAERVLIKVGEYKIGDILEGKQITGFGKQWTESALSHGQLYQPCDWGRCEGEPVCVNCFKCAKHCSCGEQITYCYAYFS